VKILAISDIHGHLPEVGPADLLLIAGDLSMGLASTADQMRFWYETLPKWAESIPVTQIVATGGNHDYVLEAVVEHGLAVPPVPKLTLLVEAEIQVGNLRIFGTPYNDVEGMAFGRDRFTLARRFGRIPSGCDILLTHMPPSGCGAGKTRIKSTTGRWEPVDLGNRALEAQIKEVRPHAVICGHVHSAHGRYELDGIPVLNVAAVNRRYELERSPTELVLEEQCSRSTP